MWWRLISGFCKKVIDGRVFLVWSDLPKVHDVYMFNEIGNYKEHSVVRFVLLLLR